MVVLHSTLTGADSHEPKGVENASSGDVYLADGASSGAWTNIGEAVASDSAGDGFVRYTEVTVDQADMASAAEKILIDSSGTQQYKIREIILSGDGTNFNVGGDRTVDITDNTTSWTVIPEATLESLAASRWGDTGTPFPASAADINTASAAGIDIVAKYAGGSTDPTTGTFTIILGYERTA